MFYRNFASFICIYVGAVIAAAHNHTHSVTGSELEGTVYPLTTENPESSTKEPDQQLTESTAVDLGALLDAGDGAVVTLVTGDTRLAAHKAVLTARSPVFAAILPRKTLEASTGEVAIPDVEGPLLRQMLAYMYTLQAPQLPSIAPQLLVAADTYGLSALKAHCEQQVAAQLSVETAVTAAVLAVRHSCSSLTQAAVAFIRTHIFRVMATQGWADAMNSQPEEFMKVIRLLSDPSAEAKSLSAEEKNSRLIEAAAEGAVQEVEALLAAGADVAAREWRRNTALHWAARGGHVEVARRLLAAGAAVDARNIVQWTPLHMAAYWEQAAVARLLVEEASADVNARDVDGLTPLHVAAQQGDAAVVRLLVEEVTANVNARTDRRRTPLHEAAFYGEAEAAAVLLQAGADRGARDNEGRTPLDDARRKNHQRLVDMLT